VKITKKLREMKDADAHFVSLVTRSANRIPIRILKRDKESHMIDLTSISRVLKREAAARVPEVTALVVEKNEAFEDVKAAIQESGFSVENIIENADGSVVIAQKADPEQNVDVVRMNDHLVALVRNMPDVQVLPALKAEGFMHGPEACNALVNELVKKSDFEGAQAAVEYTRELNAAIPAEVHAAAAAVEAAVKKERVSQGGTLNDPKVLTTGSMTDGKETPAPAAGGAAQVQGSPAPLATDSMNASASDSVPKDGPAGFDKGIWEGLTDEQKLAILGWSSQGVQKGENPFAKAKEKEVPAAAPVAEGAAAVAAAPAVEDDEEEAKEKMLVAMKAAMAPVFEQMQGLSAQLQTVIKTQKDQSDKVAALSQKSEQVEKAVKGTVVAAPRGGDVPAGGIRIAQKSDDPRSGCFDTAFIRKQ
jgi:hypothetical protein